MSEETPKKKSSALKWIMIGCGGLIVITIVGIGALGMLGSAVIDNIDLDEVEDSINDAADEVLEDISEEIEDAVPEEIVEVDLESFVAEYDANQISAEKKYTGKTISTSGYIDNISEDILGKIYVSVNPTDEEYYFGTYIQCFPTDEDSVLTLTNGDPISIKGLVDDQSLGIIGIDDCEVI